jgi:superfamily II DNA or RNA helicase
MNSTNFAVELTEHFRSLKNDTRLRDHQLFVVDYLKTNNGLLVKHDLGTGKSLIMAAILAEQLNQVIFLSAKSLHGNTKKAIEEYARMSGKDIEADYEFVTMNASNMIEQFKKVTEKNLSVKFNTLSKLNLDDKVLIIDEAHNLFNSITNGSSNAMRLYEAIMRAKNLKTIFLTGTPIVNHPFELVPCYNMIARREVLPSNYEDFNMYFIDEKNNSIKNRAKFQDRIVGLTSYYGDMYGIELNSNDFPESLKIIIEKIPMSDAQFQWYSVARDIEILEAAKSKGAKSSRLQKPKGLFKSSFMRLSRQISNIVYPPHAIISEKTVKLLADKVTDADLVDIHKLSPKIAKIYDNLMNPKNEGKHLIYSSFVESGINMIARFLVINGWKEFGAQSTPNDIVVDEEVKLNGESDIDANSDAEELYIDTSAPDDLIAKKGGAKSKPKKTSAKPRAAKPQSKSPQKPASTTKHNYKFLRITGEVDAEERHSLIKRFNAESNTLGEDIKLIMISGAGAEGIDLNCVRFIHIEEPYWNWMRIKQVIGRGVRYKSHMMLPSKFRTVQPFIYISDYPANIDKQNNLFKNEKTTDFSILEKSININKLVNQFYFTITEAAIDCGIHNKNSKVHCRLCTPTGEPLYVNDIAKDMQVRSPCTQLKKEEMSAEEIIVDDKKYAIADGILLEFKPELDGYIEVARDDPIYVQLADKLKK